MLSWQEVLYLPSCSTSGTVCIHIKLCRRTQNGSSPHWIPRIRSSNTIVRPAPYWKTHYWDRLHNTPTVQLLHCFPANWFTLSCHANSSTKPLHYPAIPHKYHANPKMQVAADFKPDAPAKVAVKGREALMDSLEDIIFGSVSPALKFLGPPTNIFRLLVLQVNI